MRLSKFVFLILACALAAQTTYAASFVVPTDRDMVHRAHAIVIGSMLSSYTQLNDDGGVETVTTIEIEDVIKGGGFGETLTVVEPGGEYGTHVMIIAGVPRFQQGRRMLLMLANVGHDRWAVTDLVLGKFTFVTDRSGRRLLVRDAGEIVGWDPDLSPHSEPLRDADKFLQFVRTEARGGIAAMDYVVPATSNLQATTTSLAPATNIAPFTATSYTSSDSNGTGARWNVFPSAVSWFRGVTAEPGAANGGDTAINNAFAAWDNDCGSNVNYVYAGIDNGTHTSGLHGSDGANTILFEQDLTSWGAGAFTCTSNSYSGVLGIGGVTRTSGSNTLGAETFFTSVEGDVMMNQGIANCTLLFNSGDFDSAVTHEVGHTLGFRHSDKDRTDTAACSTDPSLECSSSAIMTAFVTAGLHAALQTWDQHAVDALYPGNVCAPAGCTPPSISSQPAGTTISAGTGVTLSVTASGSTPLTYQWYQGSSGSTNLPIPNSNSPTITVSPGTTASFWAQVSNSCGSVNSAAATITVNVTTAAPTTSTKLYLVTPCRLIDTRNANGPYGGPILAPGSVRTVTAIGQCGIPTGTNSIAINLTEINPTASGFLTAYPGTGAAPPTTSTLNFSTKRQALANNAVVRLSSDGKISIYLNSAGPVHFIIDVDGYFK